VPSPRWDGTRANQAAFLCDEPLLLFEGTFLPLRRASERPMAMACLRLFTFLPLLPDFNVPRLNSCISRFTSLPALGLYLRWELLREDLRLELELRLRDVERCLVAIMKICLLIGTLQS
jgi:hypothetical protein